MDHWPLSFFGLQASRGLAERVAARLDIVLAPHEEWTFEDGEHKTRPPRDVRGHDVFVRHSSHGDACENGNDKPCRLLFFRGALNGAGADRVTAATPRLCYARKDRRTKPNDPVITRYVAAMFEAVGIDPVIAAEVHNVAAFENAFRCPTWHIEIAPLLAAHFAPLPRGETVVAVSPGTGGAKRAEQFRQAREHLTRTDVGNAYMEKYRGGGVVSGELLAGDVRGKVAVIVDDLISTGSTLVWAAKACRAAGATKVFAAAAHGLYVGGATELFASSELDAIVVSDTVPPFRVPAEVAAGRLTVLDVSDAIARAMMACHHAS